MATVKDNADKFIKSVRDCIDRTVIRYQDSWPLMANRDWRNYVLGQIGGEFSPPDDLDDWTYVLRRPASPIPSLSLEDEYNA